MTYTCTVTAAPTVTTGAAAAATPYHRSHAPHALQHPRVSRRNHHWQPNERCRYPRRRVTPAFVIGSVFLIFGIAMCFMIPAPAWFIALDLTVAYIPMAWIGGMTGRSHAGAPPRSLFLRKLQPTPTDPRT